MFQLFLFKKKKERQKNNIKQPRIPHWLDMLAGLDVWSGV